MAAPKGLCPSGTFEKDDFLSRINGDALRARHTEVLAEAKVKLDCQWQEYLKERMQEFLKEVENPLVENPSTFLYVDKIKQFGQSILGVTQWVNSVGLNYSFKPTDTYIQVDLYSIV